MVNLRITPLLCQLSYTAYRSRSGTTAAAMVQTPGATPLDCLTDVRTLLSRGPVFLREASRFVAGAGFEPATHCSRSSSLSRFRVIRL